MRHGHHVISLSFDITQYHTKYRHISLISRRLHVISLSYHIACKLYRHYAHITYITPISHRHHVISLSYDITPYHSISCTSRGYRTYITYNPLIPYHISYHVHTTHVTPMSLYITHVTSYHMDIMSHHTIPGSLGDLPRCSAHRATPPRPQVADSWMTFS